MQNGPAGASTIGVNLIPCPSSRNSTQGRSAASRNRIWICPSSRVEARWWAGQWLPAFQPFRASWQMAIRPFTPFPPPPLKFRTAGFPQYRLQAGCQQRPSWLTPLIRCHSRDLPGERLFRSRTFVQAALTVSDTTHPPSGPWLRQRLFCPPASSLTMATSETLAFRIGLWFMPERVLEYQSFPNLLREPVGFVSFPVPRRFPRLLLTVA